MKTMKRGSAAIALAAGVVTSTALAEVCVDNPEWAIVLSDHGYSDILIDLRPGFVGREYLSGEWAAAIEFVEIPTGGPMWLEPDFVFPDWTTNSTFAVAKPIGPTGGFNAFGMPIFDSVIANAFVSIRIVYEMIDTGGIEQGTTPVLPAGPGASVTSTPFVLKQTYEITNLTPEPLLDFRIYHLLHGLNSLTSTFDDRPYPDPLVGFVHDTTLVGQDRNNSYVDPFVLGCPGSLEFEPADVLHEDTLTFHTPAPPADFGNGYYGSRFLGDDHVAGKPSVGQHLDVEAGVLGMLPLFDPGDPDYPLMVPTFGDTDPDDLWVAGTQMHALGDIPPDGTAVFEVLLSLSTETMDAPPPPPTHRLPSPALALWLTALGLGGLALRLQRRRS